MLVGVKNVYIGYQPQMRSISLAAYRDDLLLTSVTYVHMHTPEIQSQQEQDDNNENENGYGFGRLHCHLYELLNIPGGQNETATRLFTFAEKLWKNAFIVTNNERGVVFKMQRSDANMSSVERQVSSLIEAGDDSCFACGHHQHAICYLNLSDVINDT